MFCCSVPLTSRTKDPAKSKWTYSSQTGAWRPENHLHVREDLDVSRIRCFEVKNTLPACYCPPLPPSTWSHRRAREAWWWFLWTANQPEITAGDSCTQTGSKTLSRSTLMLCKCKQLSFLKPSSALSSGVKIEGFSKSLCFFPTLLFFNPSPIITNKPKTTKTTLQNKQENEREESKQGVDERLSAGTWSCETY